MILGIPAGNKVSLGTRVFDVVTECILVYVWNSSGYIEMRLNILLEAMAKIWYFGHRMRAQSLEKDIMLGITTGAKEKVKPHMRWMDDIRSITELVSARQVKVTLISEQHSQEEKTYRCNKEDNGKPFLQECCLVHHQES